MTRIILLTPPLGVLPRDLLENAVRLNPAFDGWGILHSGPDWLLLRCENVLLIEFIKKAQPSWAQLLPPLSAGEDRIPATARTLLQGRLPATRIKGTVRDFVADVINDEDFD